MDAELPPNSPWQARSSDNSAFDRTPSRRSVGPYRDTIHALTSHRDALLHELGRARAAAARTPALEAQLAQLDAVLGVPSRPRPLGTFARRAWRTLGVALVLVTSVATATTIALIRARAAGADAAESPIGATDLKPRPTPKLDSEPSVTISVPVPEARGSSEPSAGPITVSDLDAHVRWIAPQVWEIDGCLLERALTEPSDLHSPRTLLPHDRDGRPSGLRIFGVRRDGIGGRLGLETGDVLLELNGVPLTDPDNVLDLYMRARYADAFFLRLERDGEERVHVYRVVR